MENKIDISSEDPLRHIGEVLIIDRQYFIPDIEDIRVGYECETNYPTGGTEFVKEILTAEDLGFHLTMIKQPNLPYTYRVPYLTKEQIEAEGWIWQEGANRPKWVRGNFILKMNLVKEIRISLIEIENGYDEEFPCYGGNCKCINDFRIIMKLLCIK